MDGVTLYESFYEVNRAADKTVISQLTNARKYGYLSFSTQDEAILYKKKAAEELIAKDRKHNKTVQWQTDSRPLGPEAAPGDPLSVAARKQVHVVGADLQSHREEMERVQTTTDFKMQQIQAENAALKESVAMLQKQFAEFQSKQ